MNAGYALAAVVVGAPAVAIVAVAVALEILSATGVIEPGPPRGWFVLVLVIAPVWAFFMAPVVERWAAQIELALRVRTRDFPLPPNGWLAIGDGELTVWQWRVLRPFRLRDEPVCRLPAKGWVLELPPRYDKSGRSVTLTDPSGRSVPVAYWVGADLDEFARELRRAQTGDGIADGLPDGAHP